MGGPNGLGGLITCDYTTSYTLTVGKTTTTARGPGCLIPNQHRVASLVKQVLGTRSFPAPIPAWGGTTVYCGGLTYGTTAAQPASEKTTTVAGMPRWDFTSMPRRQPLAVTVRLSVDALFANTMPRVSMAATSNVGIDTTLGNFTYSSNIPVTTRGLVKLGANTLVLTGNNSYCGPTIVINGVLQLGNSAALGGGSAGPLNVSGGTLDLAGFSPPRLAASP